MMSVGFVALTGALSGLSLAKPVWFGSVRSLSLFVIQSPHELELLRLANFCGVGKGQTTVPR